MENILLVEPAEAVSENVKEANVLRTDPLAATRLVSTPAQIKEKINSKMTPEGRYILNDQFSEATVTDINGNNLLNNEYYSFVSRDGDKLYMAKNNPETDVVEFSIADKKIVEEAKEEVAETPVEEVVTEPVQEVAPAEEVTTEPVEVVTEPVQEETVEPQSVENINEGFAKEDIDLGQEISIPAVDTVVETPIQNNIPTSNSFMDLITDPNATNSVEKESFDEIKEETPTTEINNDEVVAEVEEKELTDEDMDNRESDLERRLNELNERFNSMNEQFSKIETKEETPVEEVVDAKDMDEEAEEENVFTSPEVDNIDNINDEEVTTPEDRFDDSEVQIDSIDKYADEDEFDSDYNDADDNTISKEDTTYSDAASVIRSLMQNNSEQKEELNRTNEELNITKEELDKVKASRKALSEKYKSQTRELETRNDEIRDLRATVSKIEAERDSFEGKYHDLRRVSDLQKREFEKEKLENQKLRAELARKDADREELGQLVRDARALVNENSYYNGDNYSYRKVA